MIKLVAPDGTTNTTLVNRMGGELNGGNNFCQTTLDDASAGASIDTVSSASNPFTGSFKPSQPLSALVGANGNGTWQLQATDYFNTDTGSIRTWSLDIRPLACAAVSNPDEHHRNQDGHRLVRSRRQRRLHRDADQHRHGDADR